MARRRAYLKKPASRVVAVRLDLESAGFTYQKWGATQTCKAGDWIVDNGNDIYTVDGETFARTYRAVSPGVYEKVTPVWAEIAGQAGQIATEEGVTHYSAGAYLVYDEADGTHGYAVEAAAFEKMYEPVA